LIGKLIRHLRSPLRRWAPLRLRVRLAAPLLCLFVVYLPALVLPQLSGVPLIRGFYPPSQLGAANFRPLIPPMKAPANITLEAWTASELLQDCVWLAGQLSPLLLLAAAIAITASAVADERNRGTMEAALLTTTSREEILTGWVAGTWRPWFRIGVYLIPVYVLSCIWAATWLPSSWVQMTGIAGGGSDLSDLASEVHGYPGWWQLTAGIVMLVLRVLHDASVCALGATVALRVALRSSTRAGALAVGFAVGFPVAVASVILPRALVSAVEALARLVHISFHGEAVLFTYLIAVALFVLARQVAASRLFVSTAQNLDARLLGST
jgi:hypothetical protein